MHGKDKARSIPARLYQPLIDAHPECDFFSLQCGPAQPEIAELRGVTDLAPEVRNWTDTAQMLACMDLLVSVDTACVHLAGAMGTPAWMLCPTSPDFRWQLTREDSPWYPKMRLFRQTDRNDWQTPIQRITHALTTF
jgi:ADP-heptose:LPS heptosyltransferase